MDDLRNRIGIFRVSNDLLNARVYDVQHMQTDMVVLIADRGLDVTQYVALHPGFEIVPADTTPAEYEFTDDTWQRIDR